MIANYGYVDGSGEYYISIDTDCCITCSHRGCLTACPQHIFEIITDDYDDEVAAIKSSFKNTLKYTCAACKPTDRRLAGGQSCRTGQDVEPSGQSAGGQSCRTGQDVEPSGQSAGGQSCRTGQDVEPSGQSAGGQEMPPTDHKPPLPCVTACTPGAIKHTW